MSIANDRMWSAYLDGELGASEASEFDRGLTVSEKRRMAGEVVLERALADVLGRGAACPEAVWARLRETIQAESKPEQQNTPSTWPSWGRMLAVAAVVVLTVAGLVVKTQSPRGDFVLMAEKDVGQLQQASRVRGHSLQDVNEYVHEHGFAFDVLPIDNDGSRHHWRELLGARESHYRGEKVMELFFDCCGKPLKVVVAPKNGAAARHIGEALARGELQASRPAGEYVTALVGRHRAAALLDLVSAESEEETGKA
ncbi:MAG: hypothetical protein WC655_23835 [Candidatus Hydrogenedentales bacterium]